jgi:hypothetical protein
VTWRRALIAAVSFGLVLVIVTASFEVVTYLDLRAQAGTAQQLQKANHATNVARLRQISQLEARLAGTQRVLIVDTKQNSSTRVTTVGARCHLTSLDLALARFTHPAAVPGYQSSLHGCLAQLAVVKAINAATPSPKTKPKRPATSAPAKS